MDRPTPVDLIVLSGFLGSGKTTLLVDFLRSADAGDTGVIVNEVGEIGVDGAIVADGSDGVPMTLLANGCVCCSLRSGLVDTVNALLNAPRPTGRPLARIILETSGLSRPGPIIASLADPELASRGLRLSVVTTYDCDRGPLGDEQFEEAAAQFAAAQRIVLTKTDLAAGMHAGERQDGVPARPAHKGEQRNDYPTRPLHKGEQRNVYPTRPLHEGEQRDGLPPQRIHSGDQPCGNPGAARGTSESEGLALHAARARALNPLAQIVAESDRAAAVEQAFAALPGTSSTDLALDALRAAGVARRGDSLRHPRIHVWRGTVRQPVEWSAFSTWLDDLAGLCGDRLLRFKALLRVTDCAEPVLIQSVGTTFGMPRRMASLSPDQDVLIVITRDLDADALRDLPPESPVALEAWA